MADEKIEEDAEKQKRELDNKKRLTQQSLLLMNLKNISKLNRDKFSKENGGYKNYLLLEDNEPWSFMTKLMGVNMLPTSQLRSHHFSALVPEIRFFKAIKTDTQEIVFPTHAGADQRTRYNHDLSAAISELTSTTPNIGVTSVDWSFQGSTAYMQESSLIVNVRLHAERISDLFCQVSGQPDSKLKYSDLFTISSKYKMEEGKKQKKEDREENPDYFRLKLQVGWNITPEYDKAFGREESKNKKIKKALEQMRRQKTLMDITLVNFDFDFTQEGSVNVNLTYKSFLQSKMSNPYHSNILFDQNEKKKEQSLLDEIEKLKKELAKETGSHPTGMSMVDDPQMSMMNDEQMSTNETAADSSRGNIAHIENKIDKKQRALAEVSHNRSATYASFVEELIKNGHIRTYSVGEENLLYRFQMHSNSKDSMEDLKSICSKTVMSETFPDLSLVKTIAVMGSDSETSSYEGDLRMYTDKSGKRFYAFFSPGAALPDLGLFSGQKDNGLITEDQLHLLHHYGYLNEVMQEMTLQDSQGETGAGGAIVKEFATEIPSDLAGCASDKLSQGDASSMTKKINAAAAKAVDLDTDKKKDDKMAKVFDEVSKPEFAHGQYNIKYFFLGDLIEIALSKLRANSAAKEINKSLRVVVGSVEFTSYASDEQIFKFENASLKSGYLQATRVKPPDSDTAGSSKTEVKAQLDKYYRNIADIPISLNCFLHWYNENYVKNSRMHMPFDDFIRGAMQLAIRSVLVLDDNSSLLPRQNAPIMNSIISVPKDKDEAKDYFGFDQKGEPPKERKKFSKIRHGAKVRNEDDSFTQSSNRKPVSLKESRMSKSFVPKLSDSINYLLLHSIPKSIPPDVKMDFVQDSINGIPHFFIGGNSGLLKSINFSLVKNALMEADQMLRDQGAFKDPRFPIKGRYDVEITMFGNTFFTPGSVICLNPSSLRLGNIFDAKSPINELGLAGYYNVTSVTSYIQNGNYETKINCSFAGTGNGYDPAGRHHTAVPKSGQED